MRLLHHKSALVVAALAVLACGVSKNTSGTLTTVEDVKRLSGADLKGSRTVHLRGTVTYGVPTSGFYFIADSTGGIRLNVIAPGQTEAEYGDEIEVTGIAAPGAREPIVARAAIRRIGKGGVPQAQRASGADLEGGRFESRIVTIAGVLMSSAISDEGSQHSSRELHVRVDRHVAVVRMEDNKVLTDAPVDSEVRVTGVVSSQVDAHGVTTRSLVWATGLESLRYTKEATPAASLPLTRVKELLAADPAQLPLHRIRLHGKLFSSANLKVLEDDTGRIRVRGKLAVDDAEAPVDVAGYAFARDGALAIEETSLALPAGAGASQNSLTPRPVMTAARAIHRLPARTASSHLPVRLRGVVTYHNLHDNLLFVQDSSDGIFVWSKKLERQLKAGDLVQVEGVTGGGGFAPSVGGATVTLVGHSGVPEPARGMEEAAFLGHLDSRWIEMQGVVQSVTGSTLMLAWGTHTFQAQIYLPSAPLQSLTGAAVTIHGVSSALTNKRRQLLGLNIQVPSEEFVRVSRQGPEDPFLMPVQFASDLLVFSPSQNADRRARVRGVVTLADPAGTLWLRDASGGVQIHPRNAGSVKAGDSIDASGLPVAGAYSVALRDADIRRIGSGPRPEPFHVDPAAGFKPELDAQFVQVDATLLSEASGPDGPVMLMQAGSVPFQAKVVSDEGGGDPLPPPGTLLRIAGVYSVEPVENTETMTRSFRLTVGARGDIRVLKDVPWWTPARLLGIILLGFFAILAAVAWVVLLRREVRARVVEAEAAAERASRAEWNESRQKQVLDLIARHASVESIADHMVRTMGEMYPGLGCAVIISREDKEQLLATSGVADTLKPGLQSFTADDVVSARRPRPLPICTQEPESAGEWFYLSFPVTVGEQVRGSLNLLSPERGALERVIPETMVAWVNLASMTIERRDLHDRLSFRASHDALTELPNRLAFAERLEAEIGRSTASGKSFALCYIDLDKFKSINDTLGHEAGDCVLREVSARIKKFIRPSDTPARLGGDEFIVMIPSIGGRSSAQTIAEQLARSLQQPIFAGFQEVKVGASIGISVFPDDGRDAEALLRLADLAMYRQKHARPEHYHPDMSRLANALELA